MVLMMIRQWFSHTQSCRFTGFQDARKFWFDFIGCTTPTILHNFTRHSRSNWCFPSRPAARLCLRFDPLGLLVRFALSSKRLSPSSPAAVIASRQMMSLLLLRWCMNWSARSLTCAVQKSRSRAARAKTQSQGRAGSNPESGLDTYACSALRLNFSMCSDRMRTSAIAVIHQPPPGMLV